MKTNQSLNAVSSLARHPFLWLMLLFCIVGGTLRFYALGKQGLWSDELHSVEIARRDILTIWQNSRVEPHPPLYYILLSVILKILTPTEANVRILSALAGLTTIPIVGIYLARHYGRRAALVGMLFAATAPVQIYYSQEARAYSLSVLCVATLLLVVREIEREPRLRSWLVFTGLAILSVYLNYFLGVVLLAQIIWLSLQPGMWRQKGFFASLLLIGVLCLPLVPNAIASQRTVPVFNRADSGGPIALPSTLESMLIGDVRYVPRVARWAALGIFAVLGSVAIAHLRHRSSLYLLLLSLPIALVFAALPVLGLHPPAYQEKQFIVLAPTAWVLAAVGVQFLWENRSFPVRAIAVGLSVVWVILAGLALNRYFGEFVKSHEQLVVNWLRINQADQQPILIVGPPGVGGALRYYAPEIDFLALQRYDGADSLWTTASEFVMFPSSSPAMRCALTNFRSSLGFWVVQYIWLDERVSFINSIKQTRPMNLLTQIGNWQIYHVHEVPGGDALRCEETPDDD